jgi:hypothetical protein
MQAVKLTDIKKELSKQGSQELITTCLRLAKYKKENKELLSYLLYNSDDPLYYVQKVKESLEEDFKTLQKHYYQSTKTLRKILRTLNRHAKYTASKEAEIELLVWYCHNFLNYADTRSSYKPLRGLFIRQIEKIVKLIPKLHEDLQFDYEQELLNLVQTAETKIKGFDKKEFNL